MLEKPTNALRRGLERQLDLKGSPADAASSYRPDGRAICPKLSVPVAFIASCVGPGWQGSDG